MRFVKTTVFLTKATSIPFLMAPINAKGASDFKSVVAHLTAHEEDKKAPVVYLNPLNHKTPTEALIQPATSSINDYDIF